jgi:hypothetical protein
MMLGGIRYAVMSDELVDLPGKREDGTAFGLRFRVAIVRKA